MTSERSRFVVVTFFSVVLLLLCVWYSGSRTGGYTLAILNKSVGDVSLILLAVVLLLGPLSRLYDLFDGWIPYRKEFGVLAFLFGVAHLYLVIFPLARRGPFGFFLARPWEAYTGLAGLLIMLFLFVISINAVKNMLGVKRWWTFQYMGARFAGIAVLAHVSLLKHSEWIQWLSGNIKGLARPSFPPANLLIEVFGIFVLLTRIAEIFPVRVARVLVPLFFFSAFGTSVWFFLK